MGATLQGLTGGLMGLINTGRDITNIVSGNPLVQRGARHRRDREAALERNRNFQREQQRIQLQRDQQRAELATRAQIDDDTRRRALRRAASRFRVDTGARGLTASGGGSNEAILLGVFDDSQNDAQNDARVRQLRNISIENQAIDAHHRNLLSYRKSAPDQSMYNRLVKGRLI